MKLKVPFLENIIYFFLLFSLFIVFQSSNWNIIIQSSDLDRFFPTKNVRLQGQWFIFWFGLILVLTGGRVYYYFITPWLLPITYYITILDRLDYHPLYFFYPSTHHLSPEFGFIDSNQKTECVGKEERRNFKPDCGNSNNVLQPIPSASLPFSFI